MARRYFVDVPDSNYLSAGKLLTDGYPMVNVADFPTREEALKFAQEQLGTDENGNICVVSEGPEEDEDA